MIRSDNEAGMVDLEPVGRPGAADLDTRVAGLDLLTRAVWTLQAAGAQPIVLRLPNRDLDQRLASLAAHPRTTATLIGWSCDDPPVASARLLRYDDIRPVAEIRARPPAPLGPAPPPEEDLATRAGRERALGRLLDSCRKPVDGLVARHLNRRISLAITRRLVDTRLTPHHLTAVTFAVGLAGAAFALDGGYAATATAGVLMQLGSILDGCDGELARLRFETSKLGEWLDTLGDDTSNVLFWAAVGIGIARRGGHDLLVLAAAVTSIANLVVALLNGLLLRRAGRGDFYVLRERDPEGGPLRGLVALLGVVLRQDFFLLLVMLLALVGLLHPMMPAFALGAVMTALVSLLRVLRWSRR
ncbi:MAG: CDP-alcohol phosphatidyltransferase family protein [Polyangiaceae bacterium]